MWRRLRVLLLLFCCFCVVACSESGKISAESNKTTGIEPVKYIVYCKNECRKAAYEIDAIGGKVVQQYDNFDFVAFELSNPVTTDRSILSQFKVVKDKRINLPSPIESRSIIPNRVFEKNVSGNTLLAADKIIPKSYASSNVATGAAEAHSDGVLGQGIIVAIIDTGTANNPEIVPLLSGNVIGGESFIEDEPDISATSTLNDAHGTEVGSMVAAHGTVTIDKTAPLAVAIMAHSPENILNITETAIEVPVTGTAPAASLYPLKVFASDGSGTPNSVVLAAMDRALTLKKNFNSGMPSVPVAGDGSEENPFVYDSLNIQVVNMSLGGPSLFPGFEIDDLLTDAMLEAGIVVVTAAGNEGFAAMTGGSPGTGIGSLAVGASSDVIHERIFRDVTRGEGVGVVFRPTAHPQIAAFSSRGPTADGRDGVDLVANGRSVFVQAANGEMKLVSGTSFSSPTVAGAAALLWSANPSASANEIKNALIEGANSTFFLPGTSKYDQGHGFLDIDESLELLEVPSPVNHLPTEPQAEINTKVANNLADINIPVFTLDQLEYEAEFTLVPGQVHQIFVETDASTHDIVIEVDDFMAQLPPEQQNQIFGDEFILIVADSQLSTDHIVLQEFILGPQTFTVTHPQPGLVRVALLGDWTNAGNVSAEVSVRRLNEQAPTATLTDTLVDGEVKIFDINVDASTTLLDIGLSWKNDWSIYPSHDLDFFVIDPDGVPLFGGATLHSPENLLVDLPIPGVWSIHVDGFLLHDFVEEFQLYAKDQNGTSLLLP